MKLRAGKEIGFETSRGADYILFSVNDWRVVRTKEKCELFMKVIDKFGCKFVMTTATEYNSDPDTVFCRVTDRTFPKIYEMYILKGIEKEESSYTTALKFERDVN